MPITSSRIAAGLITPVTGKRFAIKPHWRDLWLEALAFYSQITDETGTELMHRAPAVRIFRDANERDWFRGRKQKLAEFAEESADSVCSKMFFNDFGTMLMHDSGRLNVSNFLDATAARPELNVIHAKVDYAQVRTTDQAVQIDGHAVSGRHITFCEGFRPEPNPWFDNLVFEPAKGEMFVIKCQELDEDRSIHANGVWLARINGATYRTGATYNWGRYDCDPTDEGRSVLLERLSRVLRGPFEVEEHLAAVRPILYGRLPIVGTHQETPRVGIINGLGSKGSLLAPMLARIYADAILSGGTIPEQYCVHSRFGGSS